MNILYKRMRIWLCPSMRILRILAHFTLVFSSEGFFMCVLLRESFCISIKGWGVGMILPFPYR